MTDRDGLHGVPKHIGACLAAGIDAILGVELAVLYTGGHVDGPVVVLAHGRNQGAGYAALCRLVSAAHARKVIGVTKEEIAKHLLTPEGPVGTVLVGPLSDVGVTVRSRGDGTALLGGSGRPRACRVLRSLIPGHPEDLFRQWPPLLRSVRSRSDSRRLRPSRQTSPDRPSGRKRSSCLPLLRRHL